MNKNKQTSPNEWERGPFDDPVRLVTDRVLSLVALGTGVVALALHTSPAMVGLGLLALAMGVLGLAFGNW